jgi:hypothetical protein
MSMLKLKSTHTISFEVLRAIEKTHPIEAAIWWIWVSRGDAVHDGPVNAQPKIDCGFLYPLPSKERTIMAICREILRSLEMHYPIEAAIWQKWIWQGRAVILP